MNQRCGYPATAMQSLPGAMIAFTCEPPVLARYISVDVDPSRQDVTDAVLQIAEVAVERVGSLTGKLNLKNIIPLSS